MRRLAIGCAILGILAALVGWYLATRSPDLELPLLTQDEGGFLVHLARKEIASVLSGRGNLGVNEKEVPRALLRRGAAFVSLTGATGLRGCMIDRFDAHEPLYRNVLRNAVLAATGDARFSPVTLGEVPSLGIEVSILGPLEPLRFRSPDELAERLVPGRDGVLLTTEVGQSTFLPQVWREYPDSATFLSRLCEKQGANADRWRKSPPVRVEVYRATVVLEEGAEGAVPETP